MLNFGKIIENKIKEHEIYNKKEIFNLLKEFAGDEVDYSYSNFNKKLSRNSLSVSEFFHLSNILNIDINQLNDIQKEGVKKSTIVSSSNLEYFNPEQYFPRESFKTGLLKEGYIDYYFKKGNLIFMLGINNHRYLGENDIVIHTYNLKDKNAEFLTAFDYDKPTLNRANFTVNELKTLNLSQLNHLISILMSQYQSRYKDIHNKYKERVYSRLDYQCENYLNVHSIISDKNEYLILPHNKEIHDAWMLDKLIYNKPLTFELILRKDSEEGILKLMSINDFVRQTDISISAQKSILRKIALDKNPINTILEHIQIGNSRDREIIRFKYLSNKGTYQARYSIEEENFILYDFEFVE